MGGTIKKLVNNKNLVYVLFVGSHLPPLYSEKNYKTTKNYKSNVFLNIKKSFYLDYAATEFHKKLSINK